MSGLGYETISLEIWAIVDAHHCDVFIGFVALFFTWLATLSKFMSNRMNLKVVIEFIIIVYLCRNLLRQICSLVYIYWMDFDRFQPNKHLPEITCTGFCRSKNSNGIRTDDHAYKIICVMKQSVGENQCTHKCQTKIDRR